MRKLMWFTVGFALLCILGVYILSGAWLLFLGAVSTALAVGITVRRRGDPRRLVRGMLLFGMAAGAFWLWLYHACYLNTAGAYDGCTVNTAVEISDYSYSTDYGVAADGTITLDARQFRVRIYLNWAEPLSPGDLVTGEIKLRLTLGDGEQEPTYHRGEGIFLLAYAAEEVQIIHAEKIPARNFAAVLRRNLLMTLEAAFPADAQTFAKALLVGDSTELSYEADTDLKVSGIRHIVAVSGLHVSILFSVVCLLSGRRRVLTALLGIPVLVLFAAVAGFTPSVVRACIMQGLTVLAMLFKKEYDPATALAFAVLTILVVNPISITAASFQLSVSCVIGIFLFSGKIHDFLLGQKWLGPGKGNSLCARLARGIAGSVSVSVSTMVVTTPLCAAYFGTVSIVGILTNLLTLWAVSLAFYGIMAACAATAVWLPAGKLIAWLISWLIRYVQWTVGFLAELPFAAVYTCSVYIIVWLLFCYLLLGVFFRCGRKKPTLMICCMMLGLLLSIGAACAESRMDSYRLSVLDVGQGQCILLQSRDGNYLVDCGGDTGDGAADTAAERLLSQGINRLDGVILTHYDADHAGGVLQLLTRIEVAQLYLPDIDPENGIRHALSSSYAEQITWVSDTMHLSGEALQISLFPADSEQIGNESCMCILFQVENCDILITGDRSTAGEDALLAQTELPELEILIAGHHGSNTATGYALLHTARPDTVVFSVGADNVYGHPSAAVLNRLKLFGSKARRTDIEGTILFRG